MNWLVANLDHELEAPLQSKPGYRSPLLLVAVIWQFCVERALRWQKRDVTGDGVDETFCNFFAVAVCAAMGVPIPQLRANQLADWFPAEGVKEGWEKVSEHAAQAMAEQGMLAIAVWKSTSGSGHIAVLVPSLEQQGTWIAQAGSTNFSRGLLVKGFGTYSPEFYAHP